MNNNTAVEISLKISGLDEGQNEVIDDEVVDLLLEINVISNKDRPQMLSSSTLIHIRCKYLCKIFTV